MGRGPFSVKQAAAILGLHPDTVRDLCNRGKIEATRTEGGHRRILMAALERYVASLSAEQNAA